jgi:2'-5' RNA ligase
MRVFYVVYIREEPYRTVLNGIRVLANPKEKHSAHITVQGPFLRRRPESKVREFDAIISGKEVSVEGVDSFFFPGQSTVFLRGVGEELRDVWRKPHYGYNPHITLYDGADREMAEQILSAVKSAQVFFRFRVRGLEELVVNGQRDLALAYSIDYDLLELYAKCRLDQSILSNMNCTDRVRLIARLAPFLGSERPVLAESASKA